jgi:hypothetical protein
MQWEYRIAALPLSAGIQDEVTDGGLNALGALGWEVLHFGMYSDRKGGGSMTAIVICKRVIPPGLWLAGIVGIPTGEAFGANGSVRRK